MELYAQLDIAQDLGYINQKEYDKKEISINEIDKMIVSLSYIRKHTTASHGNKK